MRNSKYKVSCLLGAQKVALSCRKVSVVKYQTHLTSRFAVASRSAPIVSSADLSAEHQEFRNYAGSWLDQNIPPAPLERLPITAIDVMRDGRSIVIDRAQHASFF